jgi:hypothetical protein
MKKGLSLGKLRGSLGNTSKTYNSEKPENVEKMNRLLDAQDLPKFTSYQEDINHLNRSTTSNGIEAVLKSLPTKKSPGPNAVTPEFYLNFKEELTLILLKIFHKIQREGTLPK